MSNTIDSTLKRNAILKTWARAFAKKLVHLKAFSTAYYSTPLEGTDKISVPYYALETAASTDWNASNGYVSGDTATSAKEITVNKRKYQAFNLSSSELAR